MSLKHAVNSSNTKEGGNKATSLWPDVIVHDIYVVEMPLLILQTNTIFKGKLSIFYYLTTLAHLYQPIQL